MMNLKTDPAYSGERNGASVILTGRIKGLRFCIVDYGTHPCAYIALPWRLRKKNCDWFENTIDVHGGVTFIEKHIFVDWFRRTTFSPWRFFAPWSMIIGWDYAHAHAYDYTNFGLSITSFEGHKWSTQEIYNDVVHVAEQFEWHIHHDKE